MPAFVVTIWVLATSQMPMIGPIAFETSLPPWAKLEKGSEGEFGVL